MFVTPDELIPGMKVLRHGLLSTAEEVSTSFYDTRYRCIRWREEAKLHYYSQDHRFVLYEKRVKK